MEAAGRAAIDGRPPAILPPKRSFSIVKSDVDRDKGVPEVDARSPTSVSRRSSTASSRTASTWCSPQRHTIPVVQVQLLFDAGYASDQGRKLGTSAFTMAMLDEGTTDLDSLEIARRAERVGGRDQRGIGLDSSSVAPEFADLRSSMPSLALYADIVRNPAFREDDLTRMRGQWLARIAQEKTQPTGLALRTLPPLLYGDGHAYAIPFTGSGTEAAIKAMTAPDLRAYVRDCLRPDNAQDPRRRRHHARRDHPAARRRVRRLESATDAPRRRRRTSPASIAPAKPRVYLMDHPGAPQSLILAGVVAPSTKAPNNLEIQTMNGAFGGSFTSRLNMNLREDKHWAYGAFSFLHECDRPAAVPAVCAGADRQDRRLRWPKSCAKRQRRHRQAAADGRRDRQDQGRRRAQHAGRIPDHRVGARRDDQHRRSTIVPTITCRR